MPPETPNQSSLQAPSFEAMTAAFSREELQDLMTSARDKGFEPGSESAHAYMNYRLQKRQHEQQAAVTAMRDEPTFQARAVGAQLPQGVHVDLGEDGASFAEAIRMKASTLVGGMGGSSTTAGELADVKDMNPGADVRPVVMPSGSGDRTLFMVQQKDGSYKPWNAPSLTAHDWGNIVGDMVTLEGLGSLVPFYGPMKRARILTRAAGSATGAGAGGAADAVLDRNEELGLGIVLARAGTGAASAFVGEGLSDAAIRLANVAAGRGGISEAGTGAFQRAGQVEALGAPLHAGQVSPASLAAMWRRRWSQYEPALREQVLQQKLWIGQKGADIIDQFRQAPGVDQALLAGGINTKTLVEMEEIFADSIRTRAGNQLGATTGPSLSRAGRNVQDALFGMNKDGASYRQLNNALLNRLEDNILDIADDAPQFAIDLSQSTRTAKNALAEFDVLQRRPNQIAENLGTGEETLGAGVAQVRAKHQADLQFVLKILAGLPDPSVQSRAVYRVRVGQSGDLGPDVMRVDGDGNLRVPYEKRAPGPGQEVGYQGAARPDASAAPEPGRTIGTYDVNGVEMVRVLRGKLRDFFGNPMIPAGSEDARIAKKLYGELGRDLSNVQGVPEFTDAVRQYNTSSSRYLSTMERLQTANAATVKDGQALIHQFTGGALGFESLSTLKNALRHSGEGGATAWQGYKNAVTQDFIRNPKKIETLGTVDPKVAGLVYGPEELTALKVYASSMNELNSKGFEATARAATGSRGRALALFERLPDEQHFAQLWRQLSKTDQDVIRVAVLEDVFNRASHASGGADKVPDMGAVAENVKNLLNGDRGNRARLVLPKETVKALEDTNTIAAFYKDVHAGGDVGASISAQETSGAPIKALEKGDAGGMLAALVPLRLNMILASSLADGLLSKLLKPRLSEPWNPAKTQAFATIATTALNEDKKAAATDFDRTLRQQGDTAKLRASRPKK